MVAQSHLLRSHLCNKLQQGDRFRLCMKISVLEYLTKKKKCRNCINSLDGEINNSNCTQTQNNEKKREMGWEMGAIWKRGQRPPLEALTPPRRGAI